MIRIFERMFDDKTMGFKFTVAFVMVTLIPMLPLAYVSYRVIDARLMKEADEKIGIGLKTAWTEYLIRGDQMRYGMMQAASMAEVKDALRRSDAKNLRGMMAKWRESRPYVDLWIVTDSNGKVISRLNSDLQGDSLDVNGLVQKAMSTGKSQVSTEILSADMLDKEGEEFHRQFIVPIAYGASKDLYKRQEERLETNAMALVVVTPVTGEDHKPIGSIITSDIISKDAYVPDSVSNKLPWLFTSISMDGLRIATNISGGDGQSARWTILPADVMSKIKDGKPALMESTPLGQEFISTFDPIRDNKGKIIGSLDVGMPKARLWAVQNENLTVIAVITVLGLSASLVAAIITTRRIIRPLKTLKEKAEAFAGGDIHATIQEDQSHGTKDELKTLARAFNAMMNDVKERNLEKERHLNELNAKNIQLVESYERLKTTNEELEVSYEEVQSQTEELNAANEELRILNEDFGNKNRELIEANKRIKREEEEQILLMQKLTHAEKLSSLGEIVSGVAHELNNPLTTIMGFSEFLLDKEMPESAKSRLKMINEASQRSKRIIDNLLTFARTYKSEKNYHDLNSVIRGVIELKDYQLRVNNIAVDVNLDPSLPKTMLDEHQMQQVFLNLINNAQHAVAEKGGGRISISTDHKGNIIRTIVSDTGKGISDDVARRMFDPFFTTKEVGAGTGLGLSISYGIVKEHGGNIYASSSAGSGASFFVELPIIRKMEDNPPALPAVPVKVPIKADGQRALVLDDEEAILSLINEVLADAGFHVETAGSGDNALKLLKERSYDIIISDIKMRGMNGKEFYSKVKSVKPEAADRVIFISGDSLSEDTQRFLKEAGNRFLKKPFNLGDLRKVISEQISKSTTYHI